MLLFEAGDGPRASRLVVGGDVKPAFGAPVLLSVNAVRQTMQEL